jgi:hypothetical protein
MDIYIYIYHTCVCVCVHSVNLTDILKSPALAYSLRKASMEHF